MKIKEANDHNALWMIEWLSSSESDSRSSGKERRTWGLISPQPWYFSSRNSICVEWWQLINCDTKGLLTGFHNRNSLFSRCPLGFFTGNRMGRFIYISVIRPHVWHSGSASRSFFLPSQVTRCDWTGGDDDWIQDWWLLQYETSGYWGHFSRRQMVRQK